MNQSTIQVKRTTKERLDKFGTVGDSYDSLLNNFMEHMEGCPDLEVKVIQERKK